MLAYFPILYEDELLYSGIARYGVHTGTLESKVIIDDVFGDKSATAVVDFPSHLTAFCKRTEGLELLRPKQVLQNHTLLPAFVLFLPSKRAASVIKSCYSNYGGNIHTRLGVSASLVKGEKWLHICPKCMAEQRDRFGEAYLQREFQLPGVLMCSKHGEVLRNTNIPYHPMGKHDYVAIDNGLVTDPMIERLNSNLSEKLIRLSSVLTDLCKVPLSTKLELQNWTYFYQELASDIGALKGKKIDHALIQSIFDNYWREDILKIISPSLIPSSEWLASTFRKHRKSIHPLKHALLWQVFAQQESIQGIVSLAKKNSNQMPRKDSLEIQSEKVDEDERDKRRSSWQEIIALNPAKGVKEIRAMSLGGATYAWLYRHDRTWLELNKPKPSVKPIANHRVNWSLRDEQILLVLHQLKIVSENNLSSPRRTKFWYIKNYSQQATLEKKLEKLPRCKQFLNTEIETLEQYQKRRVYRVAKGLIADNQPLQNWLIIRKAGLKADYLSQNIIQWIKDIKKVITNGGKPEF